MHRKNKKIKVLMFGWEFPPFNSGGLGVACQGLVNALANSGVAVDFVLPKKIECQSDSCRFVFAQENSLYKNTAAVKEINSIISPYLNEVSYKEMFFNLITGKKNILPYRSNLIDEVMRYAKIAKEIAKSTDFDIIHAHDWLSLPAGLEAKKISGKPLVFHVHATEFDRVGAQNANNAIRDIEYTGFLESDRVIAVSSYTKKIIADFFKINENKITVVPNAINRADFADCPVVENLKKNGKKIVLFVGRLTMQKGPDYFLRAANIVLQSQPNAIFVFSGSGDMQNWLIGQASKMGIADKVVFAGFLRGQDLTRIYKMADLYVMPSVSEPFGLTALEAIACGTPALLSRQAGSSQMLSHCLKVDFWDVNEMAAKIIALLRYPALGKCLNENSQAEINKFSWEASAKKCLEVYRQLLSPQAC